MPFIVGKLEIRFSEMINGKKFKGILMENEEKPETNLLKNIPISIKDTEYFRGKILELYDIFKKHIKTKIADNIDFENFVLNADYKLDIGLPTEENMRDMFAYWIESDFDWTPQERYLLLELLEKVRYNERKQIAKEILQANLKESQDEEYLAEIQELDDNIFDGLDPTPQEILRDLEHIKNYTEYYGKVLERLQYLIFVVMVLNVFSWIF